MKDKVDNVRKEDVIKCAHCDGEVCLHQGEVGKWHAQHMHMADAEKCPGSPEGKTGKKLPPPIE